jgi:hypothetical protein
MSVIAVIPLSENYNVENKSCEIKKAIDIIISGEQYVLDKNVFKNIINCFNF